MGDMARRIFEEEQEHNRALHVDRPPYADVLRYFKQRNNNSFVVGGAVRDHLNGRPIKDIDILVLGTPSNAGYASIGLWEVEKQHVDNVGSDVVASRRFVGEFMGWEVDLFFRDDVDSIYDMIKTFDLGFCQCAYDGNSHILTNAYMHDVANKQIAVRNQTFNSDDRVKRMLVKYPDWKVIR